MKAARFLVAVLAEHFERAAKEDERLERYWREKIEKLESSLPETTADRTVEQWEELVHATGELYYAMAAHSNTYSASGHLSRLRDALDEEATR